MLSHTEKVSEAPDQYLGSAERNDATIESLLQDVCSRVAPFWPLTNFIAVNPMQGFEHEPFTAADASARKYFHASALPSLSYLHRQFRKGRIRYETLAHVARAHGQLGSPENVARLLVEEVSAAMNGAREGAASEGEVLTLSEWSDRLLGTRLDEAMRAELFKWCGSYFDLGEAAWAMPGREAGFFTAWKSLARLDSNFERAGIAGFRAFVEALPASPPDAISFCLKRLGVPRLLWRDYLMRHLCAAPGWSGLFVHFGAELAHARGGNAQEPILGYLAARLAYDSAAASAVSREKLNQPDAWNALVGIALERFAGQSSPQGKPENITPLLWLEAFEKEYRDRLLSELGASLAKNPRFGEKPSVRPDAQAIFCIDVRSECLRRHLESAGNIETFGFAGFFAIPLAVRPFGEDFVEPQCPVLIRPKFVVADRKVQRSDEPNALRRKKTRESVASATKEVKNTAVSPFALVETFGLLGAVAMGIRSFFPRLAKPTDDSSTREICVNESVEDKHSLYHSGIPLADRVSVAENSMRLMGLGGEGGTMARLVLVCGHGSTTTNNAYASALDCGACGGHRGAPNARVAAQIFNDPDVRKELARRALAIPDDTVFVAAEHDTAVDEVCIYDAHKIPKSHQEDLRLLQQKLEVARKALNAERTTRFDRSSREGIDAAGEVQRRSLDWSEARPEWGLAGNAAFIVGRRELTKSLNLGGRSFLHSYRWENDPKGSALEVIMTAPMVVTEWINTQYYFSSIDNETFGSGNKVIHNVVGKLGVIQGTQGDLKLGLPLQSVSDGVELVHEPMRLCVVIEAPKERIAQIVEKHRSVSQLVKNVWLHLVAIDPVERKAFRYDPKGDWVPEDSFERSLSDAAP